jgi:glyoxylase-like metal-dependent hydrolase (beta-lactamase superfamily II)
MRVHHLNCATMCPRAGFLVNEARRLVCHCLLVETAEGLLLVDTGFGLLDVQHPRDRLSGPLRFLGRPRFDAAETAHHQVLERGFRIEDVRNIVLTHLDVDHAGGLADFPRAQIHVYAAEHDAAMRRATFKEQMRYQPIQWAHGPMWVRHEVAGERWFGFGAVRALEASEEVLLVPLHGHTRGHCGVAVRTPEGWLLHAGDAYFHHAEIDPVHPRCTAGLRLFQRFMDIDRPLRRQNQARLRELAGAHGGEVHIFSAHDPAELERMQAAPPGELTERTLRSPSPSHREAGRS